MSLSTYCFSIYAHMEQERLIVPVSTEDRMTSIVLAYLDEILSVIGVEILSGHIMFLGNLNK